MSDMKINLNLVSDKAAAFVAPAVQWLSGMAVDINREDVDWSPDEVERRARNGGVMVLVLHNEPSVPGECKEPIQVGPRVSRALEVLPQTDTRWLILVPTGFDAEFDHSKVDAIIVKTSDGDEIVVPRGRFTSDVRMVELELLMAAPKASEK